MPSWSPSVSGVAITSDPGEDDTYSLGDTIRLKVTFSEAVTATGTPRLKIKMAPDGGSSGQPTRSRLHQVRPEEIAMLVVAKGVKVVFAILGILAGGAFLILGIGFTQLYGGGGLAGIVSLSSMCFLAGSVLALLNKLRKSSLGLMAAGIILSWIGYATITPYMFGDWTPAWKVIYLALAVPLSIIAVVVQLAFWRMAHQAKLGS